jgi:MFS family permease
VASSQSSIDENRALRPGGTLGAFKHPVFRGMWTGTLISGFGTAIQTVGASWLMTSLVSSPHMIALVQTASALPIGLLALAAGALADLFDRRIVMLVAQGIMLVVSALLAGLAFADLVTPWTLLVLTFVIGCGGALYAPAMASSLGEMVPRSDLPSAVALNSVAFNVARSLGPALGGAVVAIAGSSAAFLVNAVSYLALVGPLARWKRVKAETGFPRERVGGAIIAGLQYVSLAPAIRTTAFRTMAFSLVGSAIWALMPLVARDLVNGGPLTFGFLLGALGAGAVIGGVASTAARRKLTNERVLQLSSVGYGIGLVVVALSHWLHLSMAALVLVGAGWVMTLSTASVTVQLAAPRWVAGRALALQQSVMFGGMALGSWIWGQVTEAGSLPLALGVAGALMMLLTFLGLLLPMPQNENVNLDPSPSVPQPALRVDLKPRSGPVAVAVEYRVRIADAPAFVRVMAEHRRLRLRDGARNWQLFQDVEQPDRWIERYRFPTWADCLRLRHRATQADDELEARIMRFHVGDSLPTFNFMLERPPGSTPAGLRYAIDATDEEDSPPLQSGDGML